MGPHGTPGAAPPRQARASQILHNLGFARPGPPKSRISLVKSCKIYDLRSRVLAKKKYCFLYNIM